MTDINAYPKKGTKPIGDDPSRPLYCSIVEPATT